MNAISKVIRATVSDNEGDNYNVITVCRCGKCELLIQSQMVPITGESRLSS